MGSTAHTYRVSCSYALHSDTPADAWRQYMTALKTLIFTIVVPGTVAGIIPWLLVQGSTAVVLGETILFRSFLLVGYALLVWAIVHTFVVTVEEPSLRRQFGASYETYLRTVSRWIPRPPRA